MFKGIDNKREKFKTWLKDKTTMDFSDWGVFVLFILGVLLLWQINNWFDIETGDIITAGVLWFTAIAILQYTKETHWLKQVQQKQLNHDQNLASKEGKNIKFTNVINLMDEFNRLIRRDYNYVLHPDFKHQSNALSLPSGQIRKYFENGQPDIKYMKPYRRLDNVLAFFEKSGLLLKLRKIDFDTFYNYFSIIFPEFYNNETINKKIEECIARHEDSWSDLIFLKNKFEVQREIEKGEK